MQVGRQGGLPAGDPFGEHRLGQSRGDERAVYDLPQGEAGFETRHHFVLHEVFHFERHARQRDHDTAVAFEPHPRRCAVGVEQHRAAGGNERLSPVEVVVGDAPAFEHPAHVPGDPFVAHQFAAEQLGERTFGDVVLRGTEAAGEDRHVAAVHGAAERGDDGVAVVADRFLFGDDDARRVEVAGDGCGVGVDDLSDEDFVADGDDRGFHGAYQFSAAFFSSSARQISRT